MQSSGVEGLMRFTTIKELIEYLKTFNQEAEVLTNISFSWFKPQFQEPNQEIDKKTTSGVYIYGEYDPQFHKNKNFYEIKSFIVNTYFNKYPEFYSCILYFKDEFGEPSVEFYLKHDNEWDFKKTKSIHYEILTGLYEFCKENDLMQEFYDCNTFIIN